MPSDEVEQNEELIRRFWDEVVEGENDARPQDLDPSLAETIRRFHALDDTPVPDPTLADQIWQELMRRPDLLAPAVDPGVATATLNGRAPTRGMRWASVQGPTAGGRATLLRQRVGGLIRGAAIGTLAGMGAGFLGVGVAARIIMRISGLAAGASQQGMITAEDGRVGEITFAGTLAILISATMIGVLGGVIYVAVKPWMPKSDRWRGLLFGSVLLVTFGSILMDQGDNPDYRRFGPPELNITLFCALFIAFGLIVAPLATWLDRTLPRSPLRRPLRLRRLLAEIVIGSAGMIGLLVAGLGSLAIGVPAFDPAEESNALPLSLVVGGFGVLIARTLLMRVSGRFEPAIMRRASAVAAYAGLAIPSLVGLILTIQAISKILASNG